MPRKYKAPRKLWIEIKFKKLDGRPSGDDVAALRNELYQSIRRGDYQYPTNWHVEISWRNKEDKDMKRGEFTVEMNNSKRSSSGWDSVVINYLLRK